MRLFLFGIGGTGGRVMEALAFLLAAGVQLLDPKGNPVEVIPILLDTDATNKDTLDGVSALELYTRLHSLRDPSDGGDFFSTVVRPLASLARDGTGSVSKTFRLNYQGVVNSSFRDFIGFDQIANNPTKRMLEALYSDENMNDALTGGFLGNPNVGAVVLSGFRESADFSLFATSFSPGDRIFIVGSIFGGTGAAGLPWLLKVLRSQGLAAGAAAAIRDAAIGALTVLPYFKLEDDPQSRIDSSVFITKTKAALSYYHRHINSLNAVYYIGDTALATYGNHESGQEQANDAHLVELMGALAIVTFVRTPDKECLPPCSAYHECAIKSDSPRIEFSQLGSATSDLFAKQLTQLQILAILDQAHFLKATHQPWARENGFSKTFFESPDYANLLSQFLTLYYSPWINQLAANHRAFAPFRSAISAQDMRKLRNDLDAEKQWHKPPLGGELFDMSANGLGEVECGAKGSLTRFIKLCWDVTSDIFESSYKNSQAGGHEA